MSARSSSAQEQRCLSGTLVEEWIRARTSKNGLIGKLKPLLEYVSRLDGPARLEDLHDLLGKLQLSPEDVEEIAAFDERTYHRNLLLGNEHFQLLLLCWRPGQRSTIHDHAGSACAFRVVQGTATEMRFTLIEGRYVRKQEVRQLSQGQVCCAADADIHRAVNFGSSGQDLITLHIYSPPLRMNVYEEVLSSGIIE